MLLYVLRSIRARLASVLPTAFAIALSVFVVCVLVAGLQSLRREVLESGSVDNGVVVSVGVADDAKSTLDRETAERLRVAPGIATRNGEPLFSPEMRMYLRLVRTDRGLDYVDTRGVDAVGYDVHPQVQVIEGVRPTKSLPGVMIGERLLGRYKDLHMGGYVQLGKHRWPVVGVFRAPGTKLDSEIWCDARALNDELHNDYAIATFKLEHAGDVEGVARAVRDMHNTRLEALTERAYFQRVLSRAAMYIRAVEIVVLALLIGMTFSVTNTMYAAFLQRTIEIATLVAIGYTKRFLALLLTAESLVIALGSGALGIVAAFFVRGYSIEYRALHLVFSLEMNATVVAVGLATSLLVGLTGSVVCAIQVLQMDTLTSLREV